MPISSLHWSFDYFFIPLEYIQNEPPLDNYVIICFVLSKNVPLFSFKILQNHWYLHIKGCVWCIIVPSIFTTCSFYYSAYRYLCFNPHAQWGGGANICGRSLPFFAKYKMKQLCNCHGEVHSEYTPLELKGQKSSQTTNGDYSIKCDWSLLNGSLNEGRWIYQRKNAANV